MIIVDIPMPEKCFDCPFSYLITSGPHEGMTMCNAMEARGNARLKLSEPETVYDPMEYMIDENMGTIPDNCPISGVIG